ncbi:PLP-dependent aminotransferase family protein [Tunturibacter psychrotolerans]|uniref:PLP-dependent aminotransferase family protein n=1 Tax=Tunturiibacter psychrotolerans TaxID=3069686 RepID=A0AAU7ZQX0_9BACT
MKFVPTSFFPPVALDLTKRIPMYRQLYEWFRDAIVSGQLRPGQRVPSTRALAAELNISRVPVLNAYEQLQAEGYLQTLVGSGTTISESVPDHATRPTTTARKSDVRPKSANRISRIGTEALSTPPQVWLDSLGPFRSSLPALEHFPNRIWSKLVSRHLSVPSRQLMAYGDPMGYMPFREAIAEYLGAARAVRCDPREVMVVTGSQQGLQLCAKVLFNPGDPIWMEDPGYPGAHQAFSSAGVRMIPIPVDHEGILVKEGLRRCPAANGAYLTPSHQYPTGSTMSASRRVEILQWAAKSGSWIIEDDYDSEFRFESRPIGALQGLDTRSSVIYLGTFSKVLFPALRLGYVVVPPRLVQAFSAVRDAADIFSSTLYQVVLTDFIREGHFARHLRRMRTLYMERRSVLVDAIHSQLGGMLEVIGAEAGMHLVALLPPGIDDRQVARQAAQDGISAMPLSMCQLTKQARGGLILGYGGTDTTEIQDGVRKLRASLDKLAK